MTEEAPKKPAPRVNVRFLFGQCNDLKAIRTFYSDVLRMQEAHFQCEEKFGWVVYQSEGFQLMFFRNDDEKIAFPDEWDWMPGDGDDRYKGMRLSLSIDIPDEDFKAAVARIRESGCRTMTEHPTWRQSSYWGWTVKDPAGNTLEIYAIPKARPEGDNPVWRG